MRLITTLEQGKSCAQTQQLVGQAEQKDQQSN